MFRFSLIVFLFFPLVAWCQFNYEISTDIPVSDATGRMLEDPWAGGLNAAQYNILDFTKDGKDDLVLFDRMANKVLTYINKDNVYTYAPQYEQFFPTEITNWLLLRDFNNDGKKDIFTGDVLGIKVFINTTTQDETLSWSQYLFYNGSPNKSNVLLTKGFLGLINLQIQYDDLPSITDADGDGDLDIFNIRYQGNTIEFHQNFSQERFGNSDSLTFERITNEWGNVRECGCGTFTFDGTLCTSSGRGKHAGGKSLLIMDTNGDEQLDILISESECTNLYLLKNTGTTSTPAFNAAVKFPESKPAEFPLFPAAFYEDINFDGVKDLIVTPNIYSKESNLTDLSNSNWFYKNTGTNGFPDFNFVNENFLQNEMIDVGDNSIPAFADIDVDGDQDLFISKNSSPGNAATIYHYENIGSPTEPSFKLKTEDYLIFSAQDFNNVKIYFADLNRNGTKDLVFTASKGLSTKLYYINNKNINGLDFSGQAIESTDFSIGPNENISLVDVNSDGFTDVLVGKGDGSLQYWKNTQQSLPSFILEDPSFLNLGQSVSRLNITTASGDLNNDGNADLLIGDHLGQLSIVSDFKNDDEEMITNTEIIYNPITDSYSTQNLGGRIWPTVVNLFNTSKPEIAVGNILGGVRILKPDKSDADSEFAKIYPNPVTRNDLLTIRVNQPATMQIISLSGKQITTPVLIESQKKNTISVASLAAGIYIVKFVSKNKSRAYRIVVR